MESDAHISRLEGKIDKLLEGSGETRALIQGINHRLIGYERWQEKQDTRLESHDIRVTDLEHISKQIKGEDGRASLADLQDDHTRRLSYNSLGAYLAWIFGMALSAIGTWFVTSTHGKP